jgi:HPt (histidine-containing phosphotransfer) domain-containing protein
MGSINPKVLGELRLLGGSSGFVRDLIDLFLKELDLHFGRLKAGFDAREAGVVERAAHSLKGSSGNLGADAFSRLCAELQQASKAPDWPRMAELRNLLDREHPLLLAELHAERLR